MIPQNAARLFWTILVFVSFSNSALACLNPIGQEYISEPISIEGISGSEVVKRLEDHQDRAYWSDVLRQILDVKRKDPIAYEPTNHAVALAHVGRLKEAIEILEELEHKKPGQYTTAANLGTVYELNGENEKALKWINEGFRRDPAGHSGTEWLHIKILEAKIRSEEKPGSFRPGSVLNIPFDPFSDDASQIKTTDNVGQQRSLKDIEEALVYQLHERLEFVQPPEPIVADLLADLSSIMAIKRGPADSSAIYELAKSYGTTRPIYVPGPGEPPLNQTDSGTSGLGFPVLAGLFAFVVAALGSWLFFKNRRLS